jgi:hypothetical protein
MTTETTTAAEIQVAQSVITKAEERAAALTNRAANLRRMLAADLTNGRNARPNELADALNDIAKFEATAAVYAGAVQWLSAGHSAAETFSFLTERVLAGPDDGWSGRTNDVRRAEFEGMTEGVKALRWILPLTYGQD